MKKSKKKKIKREREEQQQPNEHKICAPKQAYTIWCCCCKDKFNNFVKKRIKRKQPKTHMRAHTHTYTNFVLYFSNNG